MADDTIDLRARLVDDASPALRALMQVMQQTARSLLPNETETIIVDTGNVRAWRHYLEMRGSAHAEVEIRNEAIRIYLCLVEVEPILFGDYELVELPDGTLALRTDHPKV